MNRRLKLLEKAVADNSPHILSGLAIVGTVTTASLAARASWTAGFIINNDEAYNGREPYWRDRYISRAKLVGTMYIPTIVVGTATIACIIGASRIGSRRTAAVTAAYALSEKAYSEYRGVVAEKIGERKEEQLRDELAQRRVASTEVFISAANGEVLFMDEFSGRVFSSTVQKVESAVNTINHKLLHVGYASVSDFYDEIGLPPTSMSEDFGWRSDKLLDIHKSATITQDDKPCIVIEFRVDPIRDYFKVH